jgi:hypothetical protein
MSAESNLTVKEALDKLSTCKAITVAEKEKVDNLSDKVTTAITFEDIRFIENLYHNHIDRHYL